MAPPPQTKTWRPRSSGSRSPRHQKTSAKPPPRTFPQVRCACPTPPPPVAWTWPPNDTSSRRGRFTNKPPSTPVERHQPSKPWFDAIGRWASRAPNVGNTFAMVSRPSYITYEHTNRFMLTGPTARPTSKLQNDTSYSKRHFGERSRDAYDPDQDGSASHPRFVHDRQRSFTWHAH